MPDEGTSAMATSLPCRYSLDLTPEMAVTDSLVLSLVRVPGCRAFSGHVVVPDGSGDLPQLGDVDRCADGYSRRPSRCGPVSGPQAAPGTDTAGG